MQHQDRHDNLSSYNGFDIYRCPDYMPYKYMWVITTVGSFAAGLPASSFVLWVLINRLRRGALTTNDYYVLNLSAMDFFFFVFVPIGFLNHFLELTFTLEILWNGFYALSVTGRPLLVACICLDCYVAVVHPVFYSQRKSLTPRIFSVTVVWMVTLAYGVCLYLYKDIFTSAVTGGIFLGVTVTIVICDYFIVFTLLESERGKRGIHPQKKRAIHTVVISLVVSTLSYIPPGILTIVAPPLIQDSYTITCTVGYMSPSLFTMSSAIMPVLWLCSFGKLDCFKCPRQ